MIHSIEVERFRCFKYLRIDDCRRINILVGDNGTGKTALLEAIFLALGSSPELAVRLRNSRGLDGFMSATPQLIEQAIFAGYFYWFDMDRPVRVELFGRGIETRRLKIERITSNEVTIPLAGSTNNIPPSPTSVQFTWTDHLGVERSAAVTIVGQGFQVGTTGGPLPDCLFFPSNQPGNTVENATRFSALSTEHRERDFIETFTEVFEWIDDLAVESLAGIPAIYASIKGSQHKIAVAEVSGGINRFLGIMLSLAWKPKAIVLVDEIENGLFHLHQQKLLQSLVHLATSNDCQMFFSTHSEELLKSMVEGAGDHVDQIAFWRLERDQEQPVVRQFAGDALKAAVEFGGEVR